MNVKILLPFGAALKVFLLRQCKAWFELVNRSLCGCATASCYFPCLGRHWSCLACLLKLSGARFAVQSVGKIQVGAPSLSDPFSRNHKSLSIGNHSFEIPVSSSEATMSPIVAIYYHDYCYYYEHYAGSKNGRD